jgi:hypothetical protein
LFFIYIFFFFLFAFTLGVQFPLRIWWSSVGHPPVHKASPGGGVVGILAREDVKVLTVYVDLSVICVGCGGKTTLLFMGVVISVYFIRVIVIVTRFYPMAIKQPMALKP